MRRPAATTSSTEREAALAGFLNGVEGHGGRPGIVDIFHAVRRLPYLSTGDRSLEGVVRRGAGSCSGKHVLLAALLNEIGVPARVELVSGDFATPLALAKDVPAAFHEAARLGVPDIHNVVRAEIGGAPTILDATWHDATKPFGFRVNDEWRGTGDTTVAVDVEEFLGPSDDPAVAKAAIIERWPAAVQARRRAFLEDINAWVASLTASDPARQPSVLGRGQP